MPWHGATLKKMGARNAEGERARGGEGDTWIFTPSLNFKIPNLVHTQGFHPYLILLNYINILPHFGILPLKALLLYQTSQKEKNKQRGVYNCGS